MGSLTETVDVKFKPLSEKSFNLIKELLETRVSCVTALSNLEDGQDINFHELHTILLHSSQFAYLLKAFLAINVAYRKFVVPGTDLYGLLGPVLVDIYEANVEDLNDELFNILKILSKDDSFNTAMNSIKLNKVSW